MCLCRRLRRRREMRKSEPAGNISPGKLMRQIPAHRCHHALLHKGQHAVMAFSTQGPTSYSEELTQFLGCVILSRLRLTETKVTCGGIRGTHSRVGLGQMFQEERRSVETDESCASVWRPALSLALPLGMCQRAC